MGVESIGHVMMWSASGNSEPIEFDGIRTVETFNDENNLNKSQLSFFNFRECTMTFEAKLSRYTKNLLAYGWLKNSPVRKRLLRKLINRYKPFKVEVA